VPRISQNSDSSQSKNGESSRAGAKSLRGSGGEYDNDTDSERNGPRSTRSSTLLGVSSPLENLKNRLAPLRHVETLLIAKLVPPNEEEPTHLGITSRLREPPIDTNQTFPTSSYPTRQRRPSQNGVSFRDQEVFVRANQGWKGALTRARVTNASISESDESVSDRRATSLGDVGVETPDEAQEVIHACRDDMIQLWHDESVRETLRRKKIRLEECSGL
jgi:guanine nucleotide-binding protein alpha-1 subunit